MNTYPQPIELFETPRSTVDEELDEIEQAGFDTADRLVYTRDFLFGMLKRYRTQEVASGFVRAPGGPIRQYALPGIPDMASGDLSTVRETHGRNVEFLTSGSRLFTEAKQGYMWALPRQGRPYVQSYMSECSTIVGHTADTTFVSHVSYSLRDELQATMDHLRDAGVRPEDTYAVASLGRIDDPTVVHVTWPAFADRANHPDEYVAAGIPEANIIPFGYSSQNYTMLDADSYRQQGLACLTLTPDSLMVSSFDYLHRGTSGSMDGDFYDDRVVYGL